MHFIYRRTIYLLELLNEFEVTALPPRELQIHVLLKPNSIVILMRNLNLTKGLCNGTPLMIKNVKQYVIETNVFPVRKKEALFSFQESVCILTKVNNRTYSKEDSILLN